MRQPVSVLFLLFVLSGLIVLNFFPILYLNIFTHSLPYGVYIKVSGTPRAGDFAASCLTRQIAKYGLERHYLLTGSCGTGTVKVLKKIKGVPGDHFSLKDGFLQLNGDLYGIMDRDSMGRPLRRFYGPKEGIIAKGTYILLSDFTPNSWDSRYWGPVGIQFILRPFWLFEHVKQ